MWIKKTKNKLDYISTTGSSWFKVMIKFNYNVIRTVCVSVDAARVQLRLG